MTSEAPPFWWQKPDWRAYALSPASALYGFVASRRKEAQIATGTAKGSSAVISRSNHGRTVSW